jgi:hypothetical protein
VRRPGEQYGSGNLIHHLRSARSERLQRGGIGKDAADMAAGHVRVWCKTDTRTGKQVEG